MVEVHDLRSGGRRALLQTGVRQVVQHDVVAGTHERGNRPVSRRPACWIKRDVLHLQQLGQILLEVDRQSRVTEQNG